MKKGQNLRSSTLMDHIIKFILVVWALLVVLPVFWIFITSFKTNKEFVADPWAFPQVFSLENYVNAWQKVKFGTYMLNSVVVTITAVLITIVLSSTVSYILVRFRFRTRSAILFVFLSGLYVPTALLLPSEFLLLNRLSMLNNRFSLIMLYVVFSLPYSILILTGYFRSLPKEMEEAAIIDGCGIQRMFWQIVFPLARNGIITTAIFNFIWIWNDYLFALTFISDQSKRTLPVGLIGLMATFKLKADWVTLFAGLNMVMLPTIILYIIFQKRLSEGLVAGAVKG